MSLDCKANMMKRFLLILAAISSITAAVSLPALAEGSVYYICVENKTNRDVYFSYDGDGGYRASKKIEANRGRWFWHSGVDRGSNRELTTYLNGRRGRARFKWTWQTNMDYDEACTFNRWNIIQSSNGLFLRYMSGDTD